MKKLKTLLVLTGLSVSLLAGCNDDKSSNTTPASSSEPESSLTTSAPTSSIEPTTTTSAPAPSTTTSAPIVEALTGIAVVSEPAKKSYRVGEQFNAEGLVVKAIYNTGREENLAADAYQLSGFDSEAAGLKTITVTYQAKTATFSVSVFGKDGIEITAAPDKTVYAVGDEFDVTGLKVSQKWGDGTADELAAADYAVSGFDSATAGAKEITVTVGEQTATFTVNVYAKAWSSEDKELAQQYLLYELPYFLGFSLSEGGLHYVDSGEEACKWIEARTDYATTEDDLDAYKAQIEAIKNSSGKQAWAEFETTGESKYTSDVDYLGFDEESEVYQYARWYNDSASANGFQILSIGLDPDGKLLAVTTVCILPLAGYGIDGGGFYGSGTDSDTGEPYDMVEELCSIADVRSQMSDDDAYDLDLGWTSVLEWPEYNHDTVVFFMSTGYDYPYLKTNLYSKEYDGGSCEFILTNNYGDNPAYTEDDLTAILAKYEAKGIHFTADSETYSVTIYTSDDVVVNGYTISLEYYFSTAGAIILTVTVKDFAIPFRGDVYAAGLANKFAAYAESAKKTFTQIPALTTYDEENNMGMVGYFIGYCDNATTGFINGITLTERNFVTGSLRQSGLLTAAEISALEWQTTKGFYAGTAKVGDEANAQYQITNEDGTELAFISGDFYYEAAYDAEAKTLTVVKTSTVDAEAQPETIVLTEENFTAASGSNNDPFAGTWDNGEFKINLGKSKLIATQQVLSFYVTREDGSIIVYTIMLMAAKVDNSGRLGVVCVIAATCVDAQPTTAEQLNNLQK